MGSPYGIQAYGVQPWGANEGNMASGVPATVFTSWYTVRSTMVNTLRGTAPTALTSYGYRVTRHESPRFRDYSEGSDSSIFREFEIQLLGQEAVGARDQDVNLVKAFAEVVMAYPWHFGLYARRRDKGDREGSAAMEAVMVDDARTITRTIGVSGSANYAAGQHAAIEGQYEIEHGDGVSWLVIPLEVIFYEDA